MNADSYFPQMADALNTELMGPLLERTLNISTTDAQRFEMARFRVGEKRYKPGKSLLISYQLCQTGASSLPLATGRLCKPGQAQNEFERERVKRPELSTSELAFLEKPAMLLWVFPHDRKLVHLPELLDASTPKAILVSKLAAMGLYAEYSLLSVDSQVIHYLPERSCMIRFRLVYSEPKTGHLQSLLLYAKNYSDQSGEAVYAVMRQLSTQFSAGAYALTYDSDTRTLWQSHVPGSTLVWTDLTGDAGTVIVRQIAHCVAQFHACRISTPNYFSERDVEQGLLDTIDLAKQVRAEIGNGVERAVSHLLQSRPTDAEALPTAIHHDLKLNNFLVDNTSVSLIDMDCVCIGNPLIDLASLIANFYLNGLREGETVEQVHKLVNILVAAYSKSSNYTVSLPQLRWQVGASLIHEVTRRSLRQLDSQRMQHIECFLDLSQLYATHSLTGHNNNALI